MAYTINVYFDNDDVAELTQNHQLIYFRSSFSSAASGTFPLCHGVADKFLNSLGIIINDSLFAYVSSSPLKDQQNIYIEQPRSNMLMMPMNLQISSACPIEPGETFTLCSGGKIDKRSSQENNVVSILSQDTTSSYTSGIGTIDDSNYHQGINAYKLYSTTGLLRLIPGSKFLLAVVPKSSKIKTNMTVSSLGYQCIVIDLSDESEAAPSVNYSLKGGWNSGRDRRVQVKELNADRPTIDLQEILISDLPMAVRNL